MNELWNYITEYGWMYIPGAILILFIAWDQGMLPSRTPKRRKGSPIRRCKHCGKAVRGLATAPEIALHTITERRDCGFPALTTYAEFE